MIKIAKMSITEYSIPTFPVPLFIYTYSMYILCMQGGFKLKAPYKIKMLTVSWSQSSRVKRVFGILYINSWYHNLFTEVFFLIQSLYLGLYIF